MTPPEELVSGESEGSYIEPASGGGEGGSSSGENASSVPDGTPRGAAEETMGKAAASGEGEGEGEAPRAYESKNDYKYRVLQKDKQIPEKFRSLIKNEADEKEIRELFEKADGLEEHFKPQHEALQHSFTQIQAEHNQMLGSIDEIRQAYQRGDLDTFFEKLQVPQQKIFEYVHQKLQYQDLPPEQRAMLDAKQNAERQMTQLQRQQQFQTQQYQHQVQQAHNMMLNSELGRPEVRSVMEAFDQRNGRQGAFLDEVNNRGKYEAAISNGRVILTPSQAIEKVIQMFGLKANAPASANDQVAPPASGGNTGNRSTIPNVGGGRSAAPVKQKPKSIKDLERMRDEMVARDRVN